MGDGLYHDHVLWNISVMFLIWVDFRNNQRLLILIIILTCLPNKVLLNRNSVRNIDSQNQHSYWCAAYSMSKHLIISISLYKWVWSKTSIETLSVGVFQNNINVLGYYRYLFFKKWIFCKENHSSVFKTMLIFHDEFNCQTFKSNNCILEPFIVEK